MFELARLDGGADGAVDWIREVLFFAVLLLVGRVDKRVLAVLAGK